MSAAGRMAVSKAQRKRWRLAKRKTREFSPATRAKISAAVSTLAHPANWSTMSDREKKRWYYHNAQQKARARKSTRAVKVVKTKLSGRGSNAQQPNWTDKQDRMIVDAIRKNAPANPVEISRLLAGRLHRTPGGVRQRITRLAERGILKEDGGGSGSRKTVVAILSKAAPVNGAAATA